MLLTTLTQLFWKVNRDAEPVNVETLDSAQLRAEMDTGYHAFLNDIDPDYLTKTGQHGYRRAMLEYGYGQKCHRAGLGEPEGQTPAFVAGYRQAALEAEAEAIFAEMRSPFYSEHVHDEFVGLVP